MRFAAVLSVACLCVALFSGCGGSSSNISIALTTSNGLVSMDETQPAPAPPNTIGIIAGVAGDTTGGGVTWQFQKKQTCAGIGLTAPQCGTLTNNAAFGVTYTAPAVNSATSVIIEADSVADPTVKQTITISVVLPPVFSQAGCANGTLPCTLANGNNAQPYSQNFSFSGGVSPFTFTLVGTLPSCLNLNTTSTGFVGTILGTPCGSGKSDFTIKVTDSGGAPAITQEFLITIAPAPPLSVTVAPLPVGTLNSRYNGSISTTGGATPLTWILAGTLPPGLTLNASTGQITGIPIDQRFAVTYPKAYNFTIQVKDSQLPTPQLQPVPPAQFSITILAPGPVLITTASLPNGTTGIAYTGGILQASGGVPPYTWTVTQGQLPSGLTLSTNANGTGSITGAPVLATTAKFTVQAADSAVNPANGLPAPATNSAPFTITVAGAASNNTLLSNQYAFLFTGFDSDGWVALAGTLTANGDGLITAGSVESNRVSGVAIGGTLTGTYNLGSDGRGTMELTSTFGANAAIVTDYDLVMDSNGNVKFFEDYTTKADVDPKRTHGEGIMKPVVGPGTFSNSNFSGNYAAEFSGYDLAGKPAALAGVFHADGNQTIAPGMSDFNDAGTFTSQSLSGDFTFSAGNRGSSELTFAPNAPQITLNFVFYFVTPSDLFFIEGDADKNGVPTNMRLAGEVLLQNTATVFNQSAVQGASVASGAGIGTSGNASIFAGLLNATLCNQSAAVSLTYDENNGGVINGGAVPPISFAGGTCQIASNGRVVFTGLGATPAATRLATAYLTGPAQGFLLGSDAAVTTGRLEQQTSGPAFALTSILGGYTIATPFPAETNVKNVLGQTTADGAGNLSGVVDEIDPTGATAPNLAQPLTATYTNPASGSPVSRGTLTATGTVPNGFPASSIFYLVSPSSFRVISTVAADTHPQLILLDH
jgi:large repetitive protein